MNRIVTSQLSHPADGFFMYHGITKSTHMNFNAGNNSSKCFTTTTEIVLFLFDYASITWNEPRYSVTASGMCWAVKGFRKMCKVARLV
jgi:hypothetical protein